MPKVQLSQIAYIHYQKPIFKEILKPEPVEPYCGARLFVAVTFTWERVTCPKCLKFAPRLEVTNASG